MGVEADLAKSDSVEELPTDVDTIIHFAANARVHKLVKEPVGAKKNFDMTFNILDHARKNDIRNIVFASSREVYGNKGKMIYSEEDTYVDECESPYTASKVGGESMVKAYENCYDIDSCILRFSNVYGKYDSSDRVIPLFIAQASRGHDLTVYGSQKVLDFTYIDDCVDGILRTLDNFNKVKDTTLNIASGEGPSITELAELVAQKTDRDVEINVEENRTGEVSRYVADISKAKKVIGYEPTYNLSDGIDKTVSWYNENEYLFDEILAS
ncbi:NAD-dependent epimerase/dehydratase family protein [Halorutilales archaeon Cl-col2-1]